MATLNLTASDSRQQTVLENLIPIVSDVLAEKINNGVYIEKDGKRLLNKKDLSTFMAYAEEEARKTLSTEKRTGTQSVCVHGDDIMSWAIHYFEEDTIEKQFILLCNKGREGWNCRSLFGVALFRSPKSTIFVLQATMRCLRQITDNQQKEFCNNPQIYDLFDKWYNRVGDFAAETVYTVNKGGAGQMSLFDLAAVNYKAVFDYMRKGATSYPNYIYALTMGLGKTVLMATCIFYEFLLANKYPKDTRYCHNALVFAPDKTVLQSLREIVTMDKEKVVPSEYCRVLDQNIKFHLENLL